MKLCIIKWSIRVVLLVGVTWTFYKFASCFAPIALEHKLETCGE